MSGTAAVGDQEAQPVRRQGGFTLLELMIAISILVFLSALMAQIITNTIRGTDAASEALRGPKTANAIFQQIFKDFRYIWYGGLSGDGGFRGVNNTIGGRDADRVDFVTARRTRTIGVDESGRLEEEERTSPLTEVGWAVRNSDTQPGYLELWRREDYFVDDDPTGGGYYTLVYDRVRAFNLSYWPIPELADADKGAGLDEWDSAQKKALPYAILVRIEFDVIDPAAEAASDRDARRTQDESEPQLIYRLILLRAAYSVPWSKTPEGGAPAGT